ncbi:MAG: flagellar M-ring protein FliF C-terminal domain-containing protein, partial [Vampirovibrionales bacterium]|nr:flagellar M-ring protein FliF C-terminal domain-containing protein [Vampirovibrionales bacterium]
MPPQIVALLQNRQIMMIAGGSLLVVLILAGVLIFNTQNTNPDDKKLDATQRALATVDSLGKAIEIQALLAREGIRTDRKEADGGKATVILEEGSTQSDRDVALITVVQSGLMDRNIGLEAFDKGDLTASREEKRIKLIRAQQGEMARLIRKMKPIEDASVTLSLPDPSIFRQGQQAVSASVQVTLPVGSRLERDQVKSIINLMVGSIQNLTSDHVALSDTNGNTYNSMVSGGMDFQDRLEEQDQYMKQKVASQLDRLVGAGHFVVTVSTLLREAPEDVYTEVYDPNKAAVSTRQQFSEKLNASGSKNPASTGGLVAVTMPKALQGMSVRSGTNTESNQRGYERGGVEESFANSKTAAITRRMPGMMEEVSIAVTLDSERTAALGMSEAELKNLIAKAASPKVQSDNVSIARIPFSNPLPYSKAQTDEDANTWPAWLVWTVGILVVAVLCGAVIRILLPSSRASDHIGNLEAGILSQTQQELNALKDITRQQQSQLEAQQKQSQALLQQQQPALQAAQPVALPAVSQADWQELNNTLRQLQSAFLGANQDESVAAEALGQLPLNRWLES